MSSIKFDLNKAGVKELLTSGEMESICMEYANQIQSRAGEHYAVEVRHYPERSGAAVFPADWEGNRDNLENNTLLRSMR